MKIVTTRTKAYPLYIYRMGAGTITRFLFSSKAVRDEAYLSMKTPCDRGRKQYFESTDGLIILDTYEEFVDGLNEQF